MVALVVLPGMDGTGELLAPFVAALGREFEITVVTYPTAEPLDYAQLESVAHAALPAEGSYVVLGESFSGPIAVSLAASASPQFKGLVLCSTFVRNPRPVLSVLRSLIAVLPVAWAPVAVLSHMVLGRFSTPALRAALTRALAHVSSSAIRARLQAVLSVDVSAKFSEVTVPVLYLRASRDRLVPRSASMLMSALNSNTRVVDVEGPHFLLQVAPAEAARFVGAFVREVCRRP